MSKWICEITKHPFGTDTYPSGYGNGCKCKQCVAARDERIADLQRQLAEARKGLDAVAALISESRGVAGLHLSGDVAPWGDLRTGGQFEEWLIDFDAAIGKAEPAEGEK